MINEAMKRQFWPNENPVGKRVSGDNGEHWATIASESSSEMCANLVSITRHRRNSSSPKRKVRIQARCWIKTAAEPGSIARQITRAVHDVDPQAAVTHAMTLEQARYESMASPRVTTTSAGIIRGTRTADCGIGHRRNRGSHSEPACSRDRNSHRLGGAAFWNSKMILGHGLLLASIGLAIGVAGALSLKGLVKSLLFWSRARGSGDVCGRCDCAWRSGAARKLCTGSASRLD